MLVVLFVLWLRNASESYRNSASISEIGFCLNVDVFFFRITTLVGKIGKEFGHNTFLPAQASVTHITSRRLDFWGITTFNVAIFAYL